MLERLSAYDDPSFPTEGGDGEGDEDEEQCWHCMKTGVPLYDLTPEDWPYDGMTVLACRECYNNVAQEFVTDGFTLDVG